MAEKTWAFQGRSSREKGKSHGKYENCPWWTFKPRYCFKIREKSNSRRLNLDSRQSHRIFVSQTTFHDVSSKSLKNLTIDLTEILSNQNQQISSDELEILIKENFIRKSYGVKAVNEDLFNSEREDAIFCWESISPDLVLIDNIHEARAERLSLSKKYLIVSSLIKSIEKCV